MAIPKPVLSDGDIVEVQRESYESASLIWNIWSQDPFKAAVLQAILPKIRFNYQLTMSSEALGQRRVCFRHHSLLGVQDVHYLNLSRMPPKSWISSLSWLDILTPGGHLLTISMLNRKFAI
jgi:hypothetical protein